MKKWILDKDGVEQIVSCSLFGQIDESGQELFNNQLLVEGFIDNEDGTFDYGLLMYDAEEEEEGAVVVCNDKSLNFSKKNAKEIGYEFAKQYLEKLKRESLLIKGEEAIDLFSQGLSSAISDFCKSETGNF